MRDKTLYLLWLLVNRLLSIVLAVSMSLCVKRNNMPEIVNMIDTFNFQSELSGKKLNGLHSI